MGTHLYVISNLKVDAEAILKRKDWYLKELKKLYLERLSTEGGEKQEELHEGWEWKWELPYFYDDIKQRIVPESKNREVISFDIPFMFSILIYEDCILLSSSYKYGYIYTNFEDSNLFFSQEIFEEDVFAFRKEIYDLISVFGGTEIIYLADNGCDKLSDFLVFDIEEGESYYKVKKKMENGNVPIVRDYSKLQDKNLTYRNITEYVFDDFSDLEPPKKK